MRQSIRVRPQYSLVYICDPSNDGVLPILDGDPAIAWNATGVGVGTYPESDGDTTVVLAIDEVDEFLPGAPPDFSGVIDTPSKQVGIQSAELERYLLVPVETRVTRIRVWMSDTWTPKRITIAVG